MSLLAGCGLGCWSAMLTLIKSGYGKYLWNFYRMEFNKARFKETLGTVIGRNLFVAWFTHEPVTDTGGHLYEAGFQETLGPVRDFVAGLKDTCGAVIVAGRALSEAGFEETYGPLTVEDFVAEFEETCNFRQLLEGWRVKSWCQEPCKHLDLRFGSPVELSFSGAGIGYPDTVPLMPKLLRSVLTVEVI